MANGDILVPELPNRGIVASIVIILGHICHLKNDAVINSL